ncbi:flavin reductase family protein [Kitasatospora sp. NPDC036755]|uniref:flavin reductase family protein n=1 Tax=Kitasatospora sp. NPDC036755 TaxID=3154600 RepID=UPI0033C1BA4B
MSQGTAEASTGQPASAPEHAREAAVGAVAAPPVPLEERQRRFKAAMGRYPSGVAIVTTADASGDRWGFTATSFCSVSMAPPLVLFCLAKSAQCHPAFLTARSWVVHVAAAEQAELALRFATRDADKFGGRRITPSTDGHPVLDGSCAVLECTTRDRYDGGDHTIVVGEVTDAQVLGDRPVVYFQRDFRTLSAL